MSVLTDRQIRALCENTSSPMISPFKGELVSKGRISYGVTSVGYDLTLGEDVFHIAGAKRALGSLPSHIDPKNFSNTAVIKKLQVHQKDNGDRFVLIPPNGYVLGFSEETLALPNNISATCVGKSTLARSGISVPMTPIEPGFVGQITLELKNETSSHIALYVLEGAVQLQFHLNDACDVSYADRRGKYMNQTGVTLPRV
jgi:dCTP deaminase